MDNVLLIKVLRQRNRLVIPGFGAFLMKETPGGQSCVFSPFLKRDDGVLREELMREFSVEQQDAQSMIEAYVAHIQESIQAHGRYLIEGMGALEADGNGALSLRVDANQGELSGSIVGSVSSMDLTNSTEVGHHEQVDSTTSPTQADRSDNSDQVDKTVQNPVTTNSSQWHNPVLDQNSAMAQHSPLAQENINVTEPSVASLQNAAYSQNPVGQSPAWKQSSTLQGSLPQQPAPSLQSPASQLGVPSAASTPIGGAWQVGGNQGSSVQGTPVYNTPTQVSSTQSSTVYNTPVQGSSMPGASGEARRAVSPGRIYGVSPTAGQTPVQTPGQVPSHAAGQTQPGQIPSPRHTASAAPHGSRPIPSALTPGAGANPMRPVVTPRPMGASATPSQRSMGGTPAMGHSGERGVSGTSRPIVSSDPANAGAQQRRAPQPMPGRRPSTAGKSPHAKASSKTDIWLVTAIIAAAVVLALMIYGFLVSNPSIEVEPMIETDSTTTIIITE